jgi:7-cyano-7-deazaguanine synthase in queuosine biosynthesis
MTANTKNSLLEKRLLVVESGRSYRRTLPTNTAIARIGRDIRFNVEVLDTFDVKGCKPRHYDLLVLCAAVEFADRRWKRPRSWRRSLDLTVPVIDMRAWRSPQVSQSLHSVLNYLTGDSWRITFTKSKSASPIGLRQMSLDFGHEKTFAVAYSDGLDSRAASALSGQEEQALCVRVAGNLQRRKTGDSYFTHIPFKVEGHKSSESSFRSRGFEFAAVTAIAAHLANIQRIVVPESGQGALGPVLLPLHNIYADYRNHPSFFRKMERFVVALLGHRVQFDQPRIWSTKGQTLRAFLELPGKSDIHLTSSHSCWQRRRVVNVGGRKHCGLCAACLLRRLSLHAAGLSESGDTYVVSNLATPELSKAFASISQQADRNIMVEYGSVGARHLQHLADMASLADDALRAHVSQIATELGKSQEEVLRHLRRMLRAHAEEWRAFLLAQGEKSFLRRWMDGGRNGGLE